MTKLKQEKNRGQRDRLGFRTFASWRPDSCSQSTQEQDDQLPLSSDATLQKPFLGLGALYWPHCSFVLLATNGRKRRHLNKVYHHRANLTKEPTPKSQVRISRRNCFSVSGCIRIGPLANLFLSSDKPFLLDKMKGFLEEVMLVRGWAVVL